MARTKIQPVLTKKQITRHQREERQKRLILLGTMLVVLAVGALLVYGYWEMAVKEPASPVAEVNGVPISTVNYQQTVRYYRFQLDSYIQSLQLQLQVLNPALEDQAVLYDLIQQEIQRAQLERGLLDTTVLEEMVAAELVRQEAVTRNIPVTTEEINRTIEEANGYYRDAPSTVPTVEPESEATPAPQSISRAEFEARYRDLLQALAGVGVSEAFYRDLVRQGLLREKVRQAVTQDVPTTAPQIHARHIFLTTREEAEAVLARLGNEEDFAALAQELSLDQVTRVRGGDLGWFPFGDHEEAFDEAAFALEAGQISKVVATSLGFHIIQVLEKDEDRELSPEDLERKREEAFRAWLDQKKQEATIENFWTEEKVPPE